MNLSNIECPINCGPNCTNNVVRNCKWLKTYVSRFGSKHGYGLFSSGKIDKDTFIIEYTGEIQKTNQKNNKYTMEMGKHLIDASKGNNIAKFINTSKTPNAEFRKITVDGAERCAVYSISVINCNEEIKCDYVYN